MASREIGVAVVVMLLAGCGGASGSSSGGSTSQGPLECGAVLSKAFANSKGFVTEVWGEQQPELAKQVDHVFESIKPVVIQSCRDVRWSDELLGCMDGLSVTDDPHKCDHLYTRDQAVGLAKRLMAAITQARDQRR
jgi:hypothetical protein